MSSPSTPDRRLRLGSETWRRVTVLAAQFLVVFLALWALRNIVRHLSFVLIPLIVAVLLASVLAPLVDWLCHHRVPRALAVTIAMLGGLSLIGGVVTFIVVTVISSADELGQRAGAGLDRLRDWLDHSRLNVGGTLVDRAQQWVHEHQQALLAGTLNALTTLGTVVAGALLAVVLLVFLLKDGPRIWTFLLRPWQPSTRELVDDAGRRAFHSVSRYVRVTALIALIDAIGIGTGLVVLRVPVAFALAALVFLGGFIPYVGAFVSGLLAIAVALVSNGPVTALVVLAVVVGVQELEGHLLQPVLSGNVVRLHPIVVLLALALGGAEGGIAGALFAIPAAAAARSVVHAVIDHRNRDREPLPTEEGEVTGGGTT